MHDGRQVYWLEKEHILKVGVQMWGILPAGGEVGGNGSLHVMVWVWPLTWWSLHEN